MEVLIMEKYFTKNESEMFQFFMIPKALMNLKYKKLSFGAKFLYGLLLDTNSLSMRNNWVDNMGHIFIYYTRERVMEELNVSKKTAVELFKELGKFGLIEEKKQGLGKPNKIYVLKFILNEELEKEFTFKKEGVKSIENTKRCKIYTSRGVKNELLEVQNLHPNYTNLNKTNNNNTNNNNSRENYVNQKSLSQKKESEIKTDQLKKSNNTEKDEDDVLKTKERIESLTKCKISTKIVSELINKKGLKTVNLYLDNYYKFKINKHNPMGFIIKAIEDNYGIPVEEINHYNGTKPIQSTNFDQRDSEYGLEECEIYDNWEIMDEKEREAARAYLNKKGMSI
jgi:hypothetical protein